MTTAPMPPPCAPRLAALRAELAKRGLDGFVVPHSDEHQGEYLPASAERLAWLTAFTGSAGAAVVLKDKAAVFVDGRYTLQVRAQTDTSLFEPRDLVAEGPQGWIPDHLPQGAKLGYDPWLHTAQRRGRPASARRSEPAAPWSPARPIPSTRCGATSLRRRMDQAVPHALNLAGEESEAKRARIAEA